MRLCNLVLAASLAAASGGALAQEPSASFEVRITLKGPAMAELEQCLTQSRNVALGAVVQITCPGGVNRFGAGARIALAAASRPGEPALAGLGTITGLFLPEGGTPGRPREILIVF
jgi:hypothetical protein